MEFAKKLNLPCAEYHTASLGNKKGLLSKQMLKTDETLILGYEVFQDFFNIEIIYFANKFVNTR